MNEVTATSWHMTLADLYYTAEEYQDALTCYLSAVFIATNYLRSGEFYLFTSSVALNNYHWVAVIVKS